MQYFADDSGAGNAPDDGGTNNPDDGGNAPAKPNYDDMLKSDKDFQSWLDKHTTKSNKTAIENAKAKWDADAKAKADEAAKLAQMNAEEKAAHEREKREKELSDREAALIRRELKAEAIEQLTEKGLPKKLADILDYTSAENCKASLDAAAVSFNEAVQAAVNDRLRSKSAPKAGQQNNGTVFEKMSFEEKCVYANEHPNDPDVKAFLGKK